MSGKQKKTSLLGKLVGKGKDKDKEEGGKKKKGKLERLPSVRESIRSERQGTVRTATHMSDGGHLHYDEEDHMGAPVTAVMEDDPYSPYDDGGSMMRQPSTINVRPTSHIQLGGGGDGYFNQPFNESPRGTVHNPASVHEVSHEHVETAHPNVIALGEHGGMHMEQSEHVAVGGSSRQATVLAPGVSEPPRMLKPGDQMEIDPRNPPTFVIDEGITLEIGDEENGFIPYEQYLANLAKQPPPKTGGTYIVQGGGDVVIQDEMGNVIRTIPGTGAMAGRGPPQIHEPTHIIPILVSRFKSKLRRQKDEKVNDKDKQSFKDKFKRRPRFISRATLERPLSTMETQDLERWKEPLPAKGFTFPNMLNLVKPVPDERPRTIASINDVLVQSWMSSPDPGVRIPAVPIPFSIPVDASETATTISEQPQSIEAAEVEKEAAVDSTPIVQPDPVSSSQETVQQVVETNVEVERPSVPTRPVPETPIPTTTPPPYEPRTSQVVDAPIIPTEDAPLASAHSFEEDDALGADTDLVLVDNRTGPHRPATMASPSAEVIIIPYQPIRRCETPTPTDELSDLSEVILSPTLTKGRNSQRLSHVSTSTSTSAVDRVRAPSLQSASGSTKATSPTLTHSGYREPTPPDTPTNQDPIPLPSRPIKSPNRPSPVRTNTGSSIPSLPPPPQPANLRTYIKPGTIPIPTAPPPYTERAVQPKASPKIKALIQKLEGTSNEVDEFGNAFAGSTRSLPFTTSVSRRGSVSSDMGSSRAEFGSNWGSYSSQASTPRPSDFTNELGIALGEQGSGSGSGSGTGSGSVKRTARAFEENIVGGNWELRHVEGGGLYRSNSLPTDRPHFMPGIPGVAASDIQAGFVKELRERRLRRAE